MQWTLLAPWIKSCPAENKKLAWANFPALEIVNNPQANDTKYNASISTIRPQLSFPGREVEFVWETPGKPVGPNNSYVTDTITKAEKPSWAGWISQLNVTYTELYDVEKEGDDKWKGKAKQPDGVLWDEKNPLLNGTSFVVLTDLDLFVTPHNMTLLNNHVVAGPAVYQAD